MTKKLFFLLPILLTAFSISAQTRTDKLLKNLHDNESKYIFVIAHRGDWRNAPENSLQSIEKAIAMKVDMIELEIQPTKDGNFICMHDETLDRTSTGKGPIKDYTTEELKKFVAAAHPLGVTVVEDHYDPQEFYTATERSIKCL